jgi:hypothetical protein
MKICVFLFQIKDFSDKVDFYIMTCVTFFKSTRSEVQCNAAIFLGK